MIRLRTRLASLIAPWLAPYQYQKWKDACDHADRTWFKTVWRSSLPGGWAVTWGWECHDCGDVYETNVHAFALREGLPAPLS